MELFPVRRPAELAVPAAVLRADAAPNDLTELAGGVILLTVERENAAGDGRALAGVARAPSTLLRVGLAFNLPRAEAPFNWLLESLTELPATGRPPAKLSRDIARPAVPA